jgi:hypothetical protein
MAGRCFWSKTNEESGDFNRGRFFKNCRVHLMEKINKLDRFMAIENKFYNEGTARCWNSLLLWQKSSCLHYLLCKIGFNLGLVVSG